MFLLAPFSFAQIWCLSGAHPGHLLLGAEIGGSRRCILCIFERPSVSKINIICRACDHKLSIANSEVLWPEKCFAYLCIAATFPIQGWCNLALAETG